MKKKVSVPDGVFYVVDEEGNSKKISIKVPDRSMGYNKQDVKNIVDACLAVMEDCLKRGDDLTFYGIGTMGLRWRAPRMTKPPMSDEWVQIPGHYVPYFKFGNVMQSAVKIYEQSLKESQINIPEPIYDIGDKEIDFELEDGDDDG
jgi:nucleoid DNA-binding protein